MEKKLYKSSNDKVLAGVCGGIAEYFVVDSVIIRLLWVVFTLMGGAGLIAYIIAAIIIPGKNIEKTVRENDGTYSEIYEDGAEAQNRNQETSHNGNGGLILGVLLIFFGAFIFLRVFLPWIPHDFFLAAILIGLGVFFILKRSK